MRNIGTYEYVIGVIHNKDIWYYVGETDPDGKKLAPSEKYSSFLSDAKRYDDEIILLDDLPLIADSLTKKVLEIQECPKCGIQEAMLAYIRRGFAYTIYGALNQARCFSDQTSSSSL